MKTLMVRTDFSLGESALKAENAVKIARDAGYTAVISADSMNIASVIPLQRAAGDDMAVICGVKLNVVDDPTYEHRARLAKESGGCMESLVRDRSYCFTALIKNEQGYRDVCELMTLANKREQFYFVPRLALDQLAAAYAKGNIILLTSDIGSVFQRRDFAKIIGTLVTAGGRDNFYSVVYPHPTPFYDQINVRAMKVASALKIEPVAFYPAYYEAIDDADIKDIAHMVTNNIKIDQPHRLRIPHQRDNAVNGRRHLLEALKAFSVRMGVPVTAAMVSTTQDTIIEACTWRWHELPPALPKMADDEPATLMKLAVAGLRKRLTTKEFGYTPPASEHRVYVERLKYEMDTLTRLGFCGYFLMVRDLMNHSRETGIPVGPGRGSSAGSLVAWCIGITNVDPIRHGLLFERFINPERLDLPDADLDFSQSRRHEVIEYLNERYGEDYVAGIPNFTYLGAASALRDTARIYGVDAADMAVSKEFKNLEDDSLSLEELREQLASLDKYATKNPEAFKAACKLQSLMRGFGRHAAGMIVAGVPLIERTPVELRGNARCIAFDKRYCEAMGLIKLDVLGLATLDLLDSAKRYIKESTGEDINLDAIPLDDRKVLDGFAAGYTQGVFQLESGPMRKLLKDLGGGIEPMSFKTVVATTALFRPGPIQSGMLDDYVSVAKGFMAPHSIHPRLEEVTRETNGVLLYQEQIMQSSRVLAGFSTFEDSVELIGTILKLVRDEELIPETAPICIVADSLASMVPNSKAEKFDKMAEGTAKDKDQLNMNDNTALARATSANFPTLALWARKYNACIIFLNQVRTKIGVMFGDPTTSPGGDSPKFYASVRIRLGASVMKDGKEKIGQDVGAECIKNKVAPPFGKCSWKFYFDPTRGLDVVESLVEYMLEEGYLPKNASGRVEIGEKKYTKSQIVEMYREKPLAEIIAALQAIDDRREKTSPTDELED
ncbi:DNA polymerase III subunit alpha [Escherichia coli]|nr:DNA polymerase III subunit alpha [Escherichia coli]